MHDSTLCGLVWLWLKDRGEPLSPTSARGPARQRTRALLRGAGAVGEGDDDVEEKDGRKCYGYLAG